MSQIRFATVPMPISPNPPAGKFYLGLDSNNSNHLSLQDSAGALVDFQSGLSYTNEDAQDAVGGTLTSTASVALTYSDVLNQISAAVLPAGVDHDLLQNFVANKHINHASVSILAGAGLTGGGDLTANRTLTVDPTAVDHDLLQNFAANEHVDHSTVSTATAAGSGLQGGGDLTATRNLSLDVPNMTESLFPNALFQIPGYSPTVAAHRKITKAMLHAADTDLMYTLQSDFIESALGGLTSTVLGTGASTQVGTFGISVAEQCRGVSQSDTGTTATGRVALNTAATNCLFVAPNDTHRLAWRIAHEALSSGTDTYTTTVGFSNGHQAAGIGANFIGFRYTDAINGGKWQCVTRLTGIDQDVTDSGVLVGIDYQVLEIRLNGVTNVEFYIDGTLVHTFAYTVAPAVTDTMGWGFKIEKSVGLLQRNLSADWYAYDYIRTASR